jgi:hypothetical protein
MYQISIIYFIWPNNIPALSFTRPSKIYPNGIIGLKIYHLATLLRKPVKPVRVVFNGSFTSLAYRKRIFSNHLSTSIHLRIAIVSIFKIRLANILNEVTVYQNGHLK